MSMTGYVLTREWIKGRVMCICGGVRPVEVWWRDGRNDIMGMLNGVHGRLKHIGEEPVQVSCRFCFTRNTGSIVAGRGRVEDANLVRCCRRSWFWPRTIIFVLFALVCVLIFPIWVPERDDPIIMGSNIVVVACNLCA